MLTVTTQEPSMTATPPPPGWYPDGRGHTAWWDGQQWGQFAEPARPNGYSKWMNGWRLGVLIAAAVVVCLIVAGIVENSSKGTSSAGGSITYQVSGGTASTITYTTPGGQSQQSGVGLPWQISENFGSGSVVTIVVQNGDATGSVTCSITEGGRVLSTNTGSGGYAVASCSATS